MQCLRMAAGWPATGLPQPAGSNRRMPRPGELLRSL